VLVPDFSILKNFLILYFFFISVLIGLLLEWHANSFNWLSLVQHC
jgi:hypothetical protein